jgi:hypothetical protein
LRFYPDLNQNLKEQAISGGIKNGRIGKEIPSASSFQVPTRLKAKSLLKKYLIKFSGR